MSDICIQGRRAFASEHEGRFESLMWCALCAVPAVCSALLRACVPCACVPVCLCASVSLVCASASGRLRAVFCALVLLCCVVCVFVPLCSVCSSGSVSAVSVLVSVPVAVVFLPKGLVFCIGRA